MPDCRSVPCATASSSPSPSNMYSAPSKSQKRKLILTDAHRRMYALEREENFRWIFKLLASRFPYPLTHSAMADTSLQSELASIGQFAEVAHGSVQPEFIWQNLEALIRESYPLEGYTALSGSRLLDVWTGDVAKLQAYVAYRPSQRQLVVAFSGTTNLNQVLHELNVRLVPHPHLQHEYAGKAKVHAGFWKIYSGLRTRTLESLKKAALGLEGVVDEVVVTGHSLGGVMSSLFVLDLLAVQESGHWQWHSPHSMKIKLMTFGAPRLGNRIFAQAYRAAATDHRLRHGEDCLKDYAVRGFNDGERIIAFKRFMALTMRRSALLAVKMFWVCSFAPRCSVPFQWPSVPCSRTWSGIYALRCCRKRRPRLTIPSRRT